MESDGHEAAGTVVETPWGGTSLETYTKVRGRDGQAGTGIRIPTSIGRAVASFHVDPGETPPETLRIVLLGGYGRVGTGTDASSGETTLLVGGAPMGWRVQAYLDPATALPVEDGRIEVMLVNAKGAITREFPRIEDRVRDAVSETLRSAADLDAGYVARVYVGLMARMVSDLDAEVEAATRTLAEATAMRDRANALVEAATEAAGPVADGPRR